jgi:hypothetical protein
VNDIFQKRVKAAAVAGWWTLLVAAIFLTIQWIAYISMDTWPTWMSRLMVNDSDWITTRNVCFWIIAIFKMCIWLMAMVVNWLTLWARQLKQHAGGH